MFYAGIDIAKRNHEAAVIGADGQALVESLSKNEGRQDKS